MDQDDVKSWLKPAVAGDAQARERLIEQYRPFVLKEAQRVCRRFLDWGRDEELSIALIAFNEAIDAHRESKGSSFKQFARLIIKRRLVDYFRRVSRPEDLPGDTVIAQSAVEEDWERGEREAEIEKYSRVLAHYDLSFEQVAKTQPKHKQTRKELRRAAKILAGSKELMSQFAASGRLPKLKLCELAGVTPRMLDRGRVYVIALALLLSGDDLPHLRDYAWELAGKGESD